jgi:hypothetical protein
MTRPQRLAGVVFFGVMVALGVTQSAIGARRRGTNARRGAGAAF